MISLIFLLVLVWQFYIGYSRGLMLQLYYCLTAVLAFVVAGVYYKRLADALTLWVPYSSPSEEARMAFFQSINIFELDRVFYAGLAFLMIYTVVFLVFRFLSIFLHLMDLHRLDQISHHLVAGVLAIVLTLVFLSMVLTVLATIPLPSVQNLLVNQWLVRVLIHLPGLSHLYDWLWVKAIL